MVWTADLPKDQHAFALLNMGDLPLAVESQMFRISSEDNWAICNAWTCEQSEVTGGALSAKLNPHASVLLMMIKK